ncbi:MAG TPA: MerR family transcriptional regulator [Myxococcota bacterium]|nr:MerR family transcriptional regulator [Myxococcota bacterium]
MSDEAEVQIPDKMFFRIGELAELIGVEPHVLRYWETEFRIRPQRSPSGQRMYRRKDISKFLRIKNLLYKQGFTIAGARRALLDAAESGDSAMESDVDTIRVGLDRLAALKEQVGAARDRLGRVWDRYLGEGG